MLQNRDKSQIMVFPNAINNTTATNAFTQSLKTMQLTTNGVN